MNVDRPRQRVAVLDFGAQYSQLIARAIRECSVYCEILPGNTPADALLAAGFSAVVLSGGPASVYDEGAPRLDPALLEADLPVLGICYGQQLLARMLGGHVERAERKEFGEAEMDVLGAEDLFAGLPPRLSVWMSHGDHVVAAPPGFSVLASTPTAPIAAMGDRGRRIYGVQFHPEVAHTPRGKEILGNFLHRVAGLSEQWTMGHFLDQAVAGVREQVGDGRAVVALSGGVDSAVAAALVYRAIGDRLTAVYVDNGLQRQGEVAEVAAAFGQGFPGLRLIVVDAAERFLLCLRGVTDPEAKRRLVGKEFIAVFEEQATALGPIDFLVQGTIYPDVVESGVGSAATIKTHHNVGGLPERMRLGLVEPLRMLFKDEVRRLGEELGLPSSLVWRQPFPGPGLAIRVLGPVTETRLETLRQADAIVRQELTPHGLGTEIWQAFAVLCGARSVGVMGDARTYGELVAVRAVTSRDGMTADWARLPADLLARISRRLVNEVPGVNRVVYDITSKPPATIEWE